MLAQLQAAGRQSTDLINGKYRHLDRTVFPLNGLCYVLAEALWHLYPGRFTIWRIDWEGGGTHWFLTDTDNTVIDLLSYNGTPFCTDEEYDTARGAAFLPQTPSKRAKVLAERAGLTLPEPAPGVKGR